jgi:SAM-dependent methyltransferase
MVIMSSDLPQTGERFLPWYTGHDVLTAYEHIHRYLFASYLAANKRVLDVSSGEGYGTTMLAHAAASVVGIDNDAQTIRHAQRHHARSNVQYIRADARRFGLAAGSIDLAVSFETIEHLDDHESFVASIKHALTPDGVLIISTPRKGVYQDASGAENRFHVRELARDEFVAFLQGHFRNVRVLGQKIVATSLVADAPGEVFAREGGMCCFPATEIIAEQRDFPVEAEGGLVPRYYLALCSDGALPEIGNSLMVDRHEMLLRHLMQSASAARRNYERLQQTFLEQQQHLDTTTVQLAAAVERERRLHALHLSVHMQLADRDDEIRRLTIRGESLEAQRIAMERVNEGQQNHVAALETYIAELTGEIARKDAHLGTVEKFVAHLHAEIADRDNALRDAHQHISYLSEELARKNGHLADLERQYHEQSAWADQLQAALASASRPPRAGGPMRRIRSLVCVPVRGAQLLYALVSALGDRR